MSKKERDLEDRTFNFAVDIINLLKKIKPTKINDVIRYQLAKAATSVWGKLRRIARGFQ